ncbi:MAG: histidine--tRNA ligase [Nitrospirae bacterium]|nr:histidine--tRNA ligase [Nitrospirota bacterium]
MKYNALKGVEDILPPDIFIWQRAEAIAKSVFSRYGFSEIRLPIIESTDLFVRSIGESTDIVGKEMYTFPDKAGRSITLRPEGTASAVRCYVEHGLNNLPSPQKFFYTGPMFRYERPQKGRQRQFYQMGAEVFGSAHPSIDAEIIVMLNNLLSELGLKEVKFELNSIGCEQCRPAYKSSLTDFFRSKLDQYCPDCKNRFITNPLRILDCKVEECIELRKGAPSVTDHLCDACRTHFDELLLRLNLMNTKYTLNPNLVRGLDYYTRTAFEVTSEHLGAQKAVAGGGRYDRLVKEFGGPETPAIGFAIGMERLIALLKDSEGAAAPAPKVFIAALGDEADRQASVIAEDLRKKGIWAELNYSSASLKSQMRKADRLGAEYVFIIGENELKDGIVQWKNLKTGDQGQYDIKTTFEVLIN